jgi:glycosyltransferase involved in cell wall biosynthesis
MPPRLAFVSEIFHPNPQSTSQLLTALFSGWEVAPGSLAVLCGKERIDPAHNGRDDSLSAIMIRRCGLRIDGKRSLVNRLLRYLSFTLGATWELLRLRPRRICAVSNPPYSPIWMWLITRFTRTPYDLLLHDVYPDGLIAIDMLSPRSVVAVVWRALNRIAYGGAASIIVLGRDMADLVHERYAVGRDRIAIIPNWSPTAFSAAHTPDRSSPSSTFVAVYSGNMGAWHDIDTIVESARLLASDRRIAIRMVGGGKRRPAAERRAMELGLDNISWSDFVPLEELGGLLASSDVALVSQRDGLTGVAVPCKLYGILAAGRPVLAAVPDDCETAIVIREEACGLVVPPHDPAVLAEALRRLADHPAECRRMADRAAHAYKTKYSLTEARVRFQSLWHLPESLDRTTCRFGTSSSPPAPA